MLLSSLTENIDAFLQSTEDESEQIRNIVYIMDRFSISLAGYHELAQINKSLPRMHLISKCTKDLDGQWDVKRTPGVAQGCQLPFKLLLENEIRIS